MHHVFETPRRRKAKCDRSRDCACWTCLQDQAAELARFQVAMLQKYGVNRRRTSAHKPAQQEAA